MYPSAYLFIYQVYELASVKDNRSRADVLKHWQKNGGVMVMGYTMYRNLVFSRFVKNKRQKETFAHTLVDPGELVIVFFFYLFLVKKFPVKKVDFLFPVLWLQVTGLYKM